MPGAGYGHSTTVQTELVLPQPRTVLMAWTFSSSSSAMAFSLLTFSVSTPTTWISLSASSFFCFSSASWIASVAFRSSTWMGEDGRWWDAYQALPASQQQLGMARIPTHCDHPVWGKL